MTAGLLVEDPVGTGKVSVSAHPALNLCAFLFLNVFQSEKNKSEVSQLNTKLCQLSRELPEHEASHSAGPATTQLQSQRLVEAEQLQGAEMAARPEHHRQHATCWTEMELLWQQLKASQEKVGAARSVTGWQAAERPLWCWCCPAQGRVGHLPQAERTVLFLFGADKGLVLLQLPAVSIPGFAGCLASTSAMVLLLCCGCADVRAGVGAERAA